MKKTLFLLILAIAFALVACHPKADSLIGEWVADKVNVQFDENRSTPELVRQVGEMEKQNHICISTDSLLVFKGLQTETQGHVTLGDDGALFCDGLFFGQWKDGRIITSTNSPLGEITVVYRKE